ncbi:MAG TPA: hypothetical protein ENI23_09560 [bacterium]|nr:hypothetical protein [bacterium]
MPEEEINKKEKKAQNIPKKEKILEKIKKYSPYRPLNVNPEDNFVRDSNSFVYYQKLVQWLIDIFLNGIFLWIILFAFGLQPFHWICILADGILVWFSFKALDKIVRTIKQ